MSLVYGPFESWLGWRRGLQVALSVIVLATAWGFVALVHAINRERWAIGFLGFPLALSWELYLGVWPFVVSSALGLFILALAVRLRLPTWRGRSLLALLLLVQAVAHVFGAVLTGGAILVLRMTRARREERLGELGRVALTGLPAAAVLAACVWLSQATTGAPLASGFARFPWRDALAALPRTIAPGSLGRALVVVLAVIIAGVVAIVRSRRPGTDVDDRALGIAAILLLLIGALAPYQIPGWQFFSQRFVPLGVALVFAVVPLEALRGRALAIARGGVFAASASWLALTYPFHHRLVALCPDAIAGLDMPARSRGEVLGVTLQPTETPTYDDVDAEVPFMNPLLHMGTLYAVVLGDVPAVSFAGVPAIHAFARRQSSRPVPGVEHYASAINSYAFRRDLAFRDEVEGELASYGMYYGEVAVFGAGPTDLALWHDRGFAADWASKATLVAHFEACSIDLVMPMIVPDALVSVRVGVNDIVSDARPTFATRSDGLAHATLTPAPCGDVAVRIRRESGADAIVCRNADAHGDLRARITRVARSVVCEGS
jgi:hypothetical protein